MKPTKLSKLEVIFATDVSKLMPPKELMQPYRANWFHGDSWGFRLFNDLFNRGLENINLVPKDGIDKSDAFSHIRAIMSSWDPKHEDKTAACACLFELWFTDKTTWTAKSLPHPRS